MCVCTYICTRITYVYSYRTRTTNCITHTHTHTPISHHRNARAYSHRTLAALFRIGRIAIVGALTDARGDMRSALLVAFGASVARYSGHTVFARTLAARLVARFARSADRMTVASCGRTNNNIKQLLY